LEEELCHPLLLISPVVGGDAAKSLARTGRKRATATRLGIYSTYSPRSSVYLLALCSNFCKPLKKNQNVVRATRCPRQQDWARPTLSQFVICVGFFCYSCCFVVNCDVLCIVYV
jgi:hypothetical protein